MRYNIEKIFELTLEGDEINLFLDVLDIIKTKAKRTGFNKSFDKDHLEFIDYLHNNLIGDEKSGSSS